MTFIPSQLAGQTTYNGAADMSSGVKITSMALLGSMTVIAVARQAMKVTAVRRIQIDDLFLCLASIFAIGAFIAAFILARKGLGGAEGFSRNEASDLLTGRYIFELLYIPVVCLSKLSILVFFHTVLEKQTFQRRSIIGFGLAILLWSTASLVATIFQCSFATPWLLAPAKCFNTQHFWIVYGVLDMIIEVAILALSVNLVANLRVKVTRKLAVVACFAPRALVFGAALARLTNIASNAPRMPLKDLWLLTIITMVHIWLCVCTACVPYMVPYLRNLKVSARQGASFRRASGRVSSLWFRRQAKGQSGHSWSDAGDHDQDLEYNRIVHTSSPATPSSPMSPGMTCSYRTSMHRFSSKQGLCISIPMAHRKSLRSFGTPRTESSCALSPTCASPHPLLSQSFVPSRKAPSPPPKTHSPNPSASSFYSLSGAPTFSSAPTALPSALSPLPTPASAFSPPSQTYRPISPIPPIRSMQVQGRKFSTTPQPNSPPQTMKLQCTGLRPASRHEDTTSPMGAAINNYFGSSSSLVSPSSYVGRDWIPMSTNLRT